MKTLSKSSGKIASVLVTGNPSTGLGDLANEFRSLNGAFRATAGELHKYLDTASKAGKYFTEKGQHGVEVGKAGMDAKALARQKANDTFDDMRKNTPGFTMSEAEQKREVDKIASKAGRDFWKQALHDTGYKMLYGQDDLHLKQYDENGKLTGFSETSQGYAMPGHKFMIGGQMHEASGSNVGYLEGEKGKDSATNSATKMAEEIAKMYTSTPNSGTGTKSERDIVFPDEDTSAHD